MAVIKQGILGGFQNKIGNVVGTSWKGISVMKSLPVSVANPRTTLQTNQRTAFARTVEFAQKILPTVIKPLLDRFAVQQSGYNVFVSKNVNTAFVGIDTFSPESIFISKGTLHNPITQTIAGDASAGEVVFTYSDENGVNGASNDQGFGVLYTNDGEVLAVLDGAGERGDSPIIINGLTLTAGQTVYLAVAWRSIDGFRTSDSVVLSTIVVA